MGSSDQPYFSKIWSLQFVTITVNLLEVSKKGDAPHSRGFEGRDSLTVIDNKNDDNDRHSVSF